MMRSTYALTVALFLTALSLVIFIHKLTVLNLPFLPAQNYDIWSIEAKITVNGDPSLINQLTTPQEAKLTRFKFHLPQESQLYTFVDESFEGELFQNAQELDRRIIEDGPNRSIVLTSPLPSDSQTLFYRATIRRDATSFAQNKQEPSTLARQLVEKQIEHVDSSTDKMAELLQANPPTESIESLLREARKFSSNDLALARQIFKLASQTEDQRVQTLQQTLKLGNSSPELAAFLLKETGVVARVGNGLLLNPEKNDATQFSQWLEVNHDQRWFAYDSKHDRFEGQTHYLTWWYGSQAVLTAPDISKAAIEVTARPETTEGLSRSAWHDDKGSFFLKHSLTALPLATQRVMQMLVMIPIGALIVAALHQMVGFSTFGTFTPVLIAISFQETGLLAGILFFTLLVCVGVMVRSILNRVQLLVVPRLSAVLTVTVLVILSISLLTDSAGLQYGLSISLFPIVILAMTIERAAVMWEEEGVKETAIATAGSLAVAIIGFLVIENSVIQHWAFVFPELLLIVLAMTLLLGRYNGYKLTEYIRFMALQKQIQKVQN